MTKKINFPDKFHTLLIVILLILVTSIIILASVPPVSKDALIHHLAIPKLYLKYGGIYEITSLRYSYYPMNLDLLYLVPLYFGNDILPKFIHFVFALLTAFLCYNHIKQRINVLYGILGALFFLSIPIIIKLSITAYVDLGLVFFSTFSILYLFKWVNNTNRLKFLTLAAVGCGLGMGIKYNGLVVWVLISLLVPILYLHSDKENRLYLFSKYHLLKNNQIQAMIFGLYFAVISLIVFSPWMIRNYIWTKNPIFPLYKNIYTAEINDSDNKNESIIDQAKTMKIKAIGGMHFVIRKVHFNESWWQILLIPVRMFFYGKDDSPQFFDGKLNPFLIILPFFTMYSKKVGIYRIEKNCLLLFASLFILFIFFQTDMRIRYITPALPPLVVLSIMGLYELTNFLKKKTNRYYNHIIVLIILIIFGGNIQYIYGQYQKVKPIQYISGEIGRDEYIENYRPEYGVIKFANENLEEDAKILCIFMGKRGYYCDREVIFEWQMFNDRFKSVMTKEMIISDLKLMKITHLIIRYDLFNSKVSREFSEEKKILLEKFVKSSLKLLFSKSGYGLYGLEETK